MPCLCRATSLNAALGCVSLRAALCEPRACRNNETTGTNTALYRACGRSSFARALRVSNWGRSLILGTPKSGGVEGVAGRRCFKRATVEIFYNAGPLGCAGRWRALQLHVPAALTHAARARHADADLGNLSLRLTYEPPVRAVAPAARCSSHRCVCQCRCHASHYTELAHRHSRRAIADGSREPEYAPPTTSPLHLPRVPHTVAFAKAQVSSSKSLHQADA